MKRLIEILLSQYVVYGIAASIIGWQLAGVKIILTGPGIDLANELCGRHKGVTRIEASLWADKIKCGDGLVVSSDLNLIYDPLHPMQPKVAF